MAGLGVRTIGSYKKRRLCRITSEGQIVWKIEIWPNLVVRPHSSVPWSRWQSTVRFNRRPIVSRTKDIPFVPKTPELDFYSFSFIPVLDNWTRSALDDVGYEAPADFRKVHAMANVLLAVSSRSRFIRGRANILETLSPVYTL